jgi:uncharacterized membrane protein YfcA
MSPDREGAAVNILSAVLSGSLVGFLLGLIGGGGSIVAVPLLLYVVGAVDPRLSDAHVAIGTSAVAVAVNALLNLMPHAFAGHVRWRRALGFALAGVAGALLGSTLGKLVNAQRLLLLFALLMVAIAVLLQRPLPQRQVVTGTARQWPVLAGTGVAAGALSGFFGIGGGFLVVPSLRLAGRMSMIEAIGSSLVAVSAFALTTAINYAVSDWVLWAVAGQFILGGLVGGYLGARLADQLSHRRDLLTRVFGAALVGVAAYMIVRSVK